MYGVEWCVVGCDVWLLGIVCVMMIDMLLLGLLLLVFVVFWYVCLEIMLEVFVLNVVFDLLKCEVDVVICLLLLLFEVLIGCWVGMIV